MCALDERCSEKNELQLCCYRSFCNVQICRALIKVCLASLDYKSLKYACWYVISYLFIYYIVGEWCLWIAEFRIIIWKNTTCLAKFITGRMWAMFAVHNSAFKKNLLFVCQLPCFHTILPETKEQMSSCKQWGSTKPI